MSSTVAEIFADFALQTYHTPIPSDREHKLINLLIDKIGLQIGGVQFPWSIAVYQAILPTAALGSSTIIYFGEKISAAAAAFINASFGHAQDFDDVHLSAITHPAAVVWPVAIAIAEQYSCNGLDTLHAAAIGMEIMLRIAYAIPECHELNHHTPQVAGPFGAAITAGLLKGLTQDQLVNALGICGSFVGGSLEYTQSGGDVKRTHCAIGAMHGIVATELATTGLTGPRTIIEGKRGIIHTFSRGQYQYRLLEDLGHRYLIDDISMKKYNCNYGIHAAIEAFLYLVAQHQLQPEAIKHVTVGTSAWAIGHVAAITHPQTALEAQFSMNFMLGFVLYYGLPGLKSFTDRVLHDEKVIHFSNKVTVVKDDIANAEYPRNMGAMVSITTVDGGHYAKRIHFHKGTYQNPLSQEEIDAKYYHNVLGMIPLNQANIIFNFARQIQALSSISILTEACIK